MELEVYTLIAEVVAAVAVVVTLIYISIELRQNTRALRTSAYQDMVGNTMQIVMPLMADRELAEFFYRAQENSDTLTDQEKLRWHLLMLACFRHWDNLYYQYRIGNLEAEMWDGYDRTMGAWVESQSWSEWFTAHEEYFSRSLRALVRDKLNVGGSDD